MTMLEKVTENLLFENTLGSANTADEWGSRLVRI